ncbi:MAG: nucleotidyl transferase AbiEii/AbiGii toxin family protein [Cyanobium sp.]
MLAAFDWGEIQPVFCGGTSLSKGHGVVRRMSEDIDFKLVLPASWSRSQARRRLSALRQELAEFMPLDAQMVEHQAVLLQETLAEKVVSFLRRTA